MTCGVPPYLPHLSAGQTSLFVMGYGMWVILRMIIPRTGNLHEMLFILAHDVLGHFEFDETYRSLCNAYYWPNMRRDLEQGYAVATRIGLQ